MNRRKQELPDTYYNVELINLMKQVQTMVTQKLITLLFQEWKKNTPLSYKHCLHVRLKKKLNLLKIMKFQLLKTL